jgi:hypothetical protein
MRNRRRNWRLKRIALAFAVAAVAAPAAQAGPLEPGATKAEFIPWVTDFTSPNVAARGQSDFNPGAMHMPRVTPSDYAAYRDRVELARLDRGKGTDLRSLDGVENVRAVPDSNVRALDRVEIIRTEPRGTSEPVLTASPSSFDWGDAGIGAGLAFAAMLLAAASALSVRQYNRLGQV